MELREGQIVEFDYHGSQEPYSGRRVQGQVVMVPEIRWEGGTVPGLEDRGYVSNLEVKENQNA